MPHAYQIHINIFVQNPNVLVGFTVNEVLQNIIIRSTLTCSHIIVPSAVYHQTNYNPHIKSCQGKVCEEEDDV